MLPTPATKAWSISRVFSRPLRLASRSPEVGCAEIVGQRLGPELVEQLAHIAGAEDATRLALAVEAQPAELARVAHAQLAAVVEREPGVNMLVTRLARWHDGQLAGHLDLDGEHSLPAQIQDYPLCRDARRPGCGGRARPARSQRA
jgi:hypothetical protein